MSAVRFSPLTTDRLVLEPFSIAHSPGVFALWSSPEVCRFSGDAEDWEGKAIHLPARSALDSDKILDFFIRRAEQGTGIRWAMILPEAQDCIGAVGLNALEPVPELAYHLHPEHWGAGLADEACRAVIKWSETHLAVGTMQTFIDSENSSSIRLAKRLGFEARSCSRDGARKYDLVFGDLAKPG